ncbi:DUF1566 domain-containing protein [Pseudomonas mosselii]|uniref:DUF1566 domain-containing protein n=1 Tax=Pseudomonas mosselii TaxID=78327 RepID=UPI001E5DC78A|nr:DUF1566 domain-containing protein [Pseudomonas mosselii]MCL8302267.1 DUF1566 domain-containing protein [Pseudomonas mosselii]MCL8342922.1 DUF1566 domain-containing protein [Pseudomonas mosselii]WJR27812.1 DUF1566 domain-containing protein [Pseudomonas mosselii]
MTKRRAINPAALPAVGQPLGGGFFAGRIFFDGAEHAIIDSGREFEALAQWWEQPGPRVNIRGALSFHDGMANTSAMAEAGSAIARKVLAMTIRGQRDWHLPSIEQLQIMRANLLQLPDWDRYYSTHHAGGPAQAFTHMEYWSSTQNSAGSSWCLHMLPWCTPTTNWASKSKGIRPVRTLLISQEAFVHAPSTDTPRTEADLRGLANQQAVATVLERFVNEDAGKFYGRTEALVAELAALAGGRP